MDELLKEFLVEAHELIEQLSSDLLALEQDPDDTVRLESAFRGFHTLKGSVALFEFGPMGATLHAAEDLLSAVRGTDHVIGRDAVTALMDCIGASEAWIASIERTGGLPDDAEDRARKVADALRRALEGGKPSEPRAPVADARIGSFLSKYESEIRGALAKGAPVTAGRYIPHGQCFFQGDDPLALMRAVPGLIACEVSPREPWKAERFDPYLCNLVIEFLSTAPADEVRRIFRLIPDQITLADAGASLPSSAKDQAPEQSLTETSTRSLRVDAERVDALADIVGEFLVATNELAHVVGLAKAENPALAHLLGEKHAALDRLSRNMHRAVMRLRLVPLGGTFRRLPRWVRNVTDKLGKSVEFSIAGDDVEADKSVVDRLFEPLLHVLRNAIDHGIEPGPLRAASAKPANGRISLTARREGDQIVIAVSDDGAGIDPDKIRAVALAKGLLKEAELETFDEEKLLNLIFAPGFSTSSQVTDLSGRGVGMDAVRVAIEALGGRVSASSRVGVGTTIEFTLPQAVLITTVLTVRVGSERFGIPIDAIAETVRVHSERMVPIRSGRAFVLRDRTLPLLSLAGLLALPDAGPSQSEAKVLIVKSGGELVGIEVDGLAERQDVLLRPMTGLLSGLPGVQGTALLGDGRVLIVLDVPELIG
jgi:two-component system, chemotaxis family, sensor kinase CheA